jgi:hypothetical protein
MCGRKEKMMSTGTIALLWVLSLENGLVGI